MAGTFAVFILNLFGITIVCILVLLKHFKRKHFKVNKIMSYPTDKNKTESFHALDQGQELSDSDTNCTLTSSTAIDLLHAPVHVRVSSAVQQEVRRHLKSLALTSVRGSRSQPGMTLPGNVGMSPISIGEKDPQEHPSGRGWTENVSPLSKKKGSIVRYSRRLFKKRSVGMSQTSMEKGNTPKHLSGSPTKMGIARSLVSVNSSHSKADHVVTSRKENSPAQSPLLAWKSAESLFTSSGAGTSLDEGHH